MNKKIIILLALLNLRLLTGCATFDAGEYNGIGDKPGIQRGDVEAMTFLTAAYFCIFVF